MNPLPALCLAALATVLLVHAAFAQTSETKPPPPVTKAPPRLPPNAAESGRIPSGVDTGSPATSITLPLGTPVPPALGADRTEIKNRSAAARAAARPKLAASSADCVRGTGSSLTPGKGTSASAPRSGPVGAASGPTTVQRAGAADC